MNLPSKWQVFKPSAYHEAGHVVAAVVQGLPLANGGMRIDDRGHGISRFCIRTLGEGGNSEQDQIERDKSIVALLAGMVAQLRFCPDYNDPQSWSDDSEKINRLLGEIKTSQGSPKWLELSKEANRIIVDYWSLVKDLAENLFNAPVSSMSQEEFDTGQYPRFMQCQKYLSSEKISQFFRSGKINCKIAQ